MVKTLPDNYQKNVNILKENINRGMSSQQAYQVIDSWRNQFESHNKFGKKEKQFINEALKVVEDKTHFGIKFM